jgi:hypothetical protein
VELTSRDLALIAMFAAVWVAAQLALGPLLGQLTPIHGIMQRVAGWLLMLLLAEIVQRFGRVSMMAGVAALVTRIIRQSGALYSWVVGAGYAFGGVIFDLLVFMPGVHRLTGRRRVGYLLLSSGVSGTLTIVPYLLFKLVTMTTTAFLVWLPLYLPTAVIHVALSIVGTAIGLSLLPLLRPWIRRVRV